MLYPFPDLMTDLPEPFTLVGETYDTQGVVDHDGARCAVWRNNTYPKNNSVKIDFGGHIGSLHFHVNWKVIGGNTINLKLGGNVIYSIFFDYWNSPRKVTVTTPYVTEDVDLVYGYLTWIHEWVIDWSWGGDLVISYGCPGNGQPIVECYRVSTGFPKIPFDEITFTHSDIYTNYIYADWLELEYVAYTPHVGEMTVPDSPWFRMTWCTINDGTTLQTYEVFRKISQWLYDAFRVAYAFEDWIIDNLSIVFPSGHALNVIEGKEPNPNMVLPEKKFWAVKVWVGDLSFRVPLLKVEHSANFWEWLFAPMNKEISGSENWLYRDDTGNIKYGYEFEPVRKYRVLSDGLRDVGLIALILAVFYLVYKLGLFKIAWNFLKSALGWVRTKKLRSDVSESREAVEEMSDTLDSLAISMESGSEIDSAMKAKLDEIGSRIGLRLSFK